MDLEKQNQSMGQPLDLPMGHPEAQQAWTVVTTAVPLGPKPVKLTCPYCAQKITSETETEIRGSAYGLAALICLCG